MERHDVIVVGAGLAGLCCALRLRQGGAEPVVLERQDAPGGRVRSDRRDGFVLDRGFQVLLTSYPEVSRVLDLDALDPGAFAPGARIRGDDRWWTLADPYRRPFRALAGLRAPLGGILDRARILRLRRDALARRGALGPAGPERTTREELRRRGFGEAMIQRFLRPFLAGVFLESELRTSARTLGFVWRMFATGDAVLPAGGMGRIPEQLAGRLPEGSLRTGVEVESVRSGEVRLVDGSRLAAEEIVVATDAAAAGRLLGDDVPAGRPVCCDYFEAPQPPTRDRYLLLDGEAEPINNACVVSNVASGYAPAGRALISVTRLGLASGTEVQAAVRRQLRGWFGSVVETWRHLRSYEIPRALPGDVELPAEPSPGVRLCGDHQGPASIQVAMASGRETAERLLASRA